MPALASPPARVRKAAPAVYPPSVLHDLLHVTVVRVSVRRLRLHAYPLRRGEVVLYHVSPHNALRASPVKPHQILFVVDGVPANHTVLLRASKHNVVELANLGSHALPKAFTGTAPTAFLSGKPDRGPGRLPELVWEYDVLLRDDHTDAVVDLIDPPVIIKEDP
jgi:hypothetical protein